MTPKRASAVLLLGALLAGCSSDVEPTPEPTPVSTAPAPDADLVCGMARADIEAVTGFSIERTEGELKVTDGVASGECEAWAPDDASIMGPLAFVELAPAASEDGDRARAEMAGGLEGVRRPETVYSSREGALWLLDEDSPGSMTALGISRVFIGDTVVTLSLERGAAGRDRAADQLALTEQVAATHGLDPGSGGS